jgi:Flp pilus assembly protein TadD
MLRDLDQRQAPQATADAKPGDFALRQGTASVVGGRVVVQGAGRFNGTYIAAVLVLLALGLGGTFWWWQKSPSVGVAPVVTPPVGQPEVASSLAFATKLAAVPEHKAATVPVPVDSPTRQPAVATPKESLQAINVAAEPTSAHALPAKASGNAPAFSNASVPAAQAATVKSTVPTMPTNTATAISPMTAASTIAAVDVQGGSARQLQAGREALAQAQSLWNAGSRDAANELLQHALLIAERSAGSTPTPATTQLLATLAREQGRMQIAEGRPQAALDGLSRLEPFLAQDADAWAMRGNAAQRLGRHQDSLRAYTAALQIRPNEQRWLLGAAVSQAALGQTAEASELAAKARAQGPISKEVQAYLRQAGVTLNEP